MKLIKQTKNSGIFDTNFKEIVSSEIVLLIGGLISGTLLALYTRNILIIPGMLIILPGFLEMRGNISGSFAARLVSGLFLGVLKPSETKARIVKENIRASFLLAFVISLFLGVLLFFFNYLFTGIAAFRLILLPFIAGIISNAIQIPLTLAATFYLYKKGHDPNNVLGPFITTTGDIISILALLIAFFIIL